MFIVVKYGDDKSLICNPTCSIVNLLKSIKARTGHAARNISIDLSDETGLVKDLDSHRNEAAAKYLQVKCTYILVEKQLVEADDDSESTTGAAQYTFVPLLERCGELFPNYVLRVAEEQKKTKKPVKTLTKSPSPAGKMVVKSTKKQSGPPPPSRSVSRPKR